MLTLSHRQGLPISVATDQSDDPVYPEHYRLMVRLISCEIW
jgi:hypothetical protein